MTAATLDAVDAQPPASLQTTVAAAEADGALSYDSGLAEDGDEAALSVGETGLSAASPPRAHSGGEGANSTTTTTLPAGSAAAAYLYQTPVAAHGAPRWLIMMRSTGRAVVSRENRAADGATVRSACTAPKSK